MFFFLFFLTQLFSPLISIATNIQPLKYCGPILTAETLIEHFDLPVVLTSLQSQLALVAVADPVIATDRIEFYGARRTLAGSSVTVLSADGSPLTDLIEKNRQVFFFHRYTIGSNSTKGVLKAQVLDTSRRIA